MRRLHPLQILSTAALIAGYALLALWAISTLSWAMGRDQGVFAWVGDVVAHGGLPYRDAWEQKGPATHLQFAATQLLLGRNQWGLRLVDLLLLSASLLALGRLTGRVAGRWAAWWAPLFWGLAYAQSGYWQTAQPDGWAAMLATIAAALLFGGGRRLLPRAALAGLLVGWAALYKFPLLYLLIPALLPCLWWTPTGEPARRRSAAWLYLGAGVLPTVAVAGWLGMRGGLPAAAEILLQFNPHAHGTVPGFQPLSAAGAYLLSHAYLIGLALFGGLWLTHPAAARYRPALGAWLLGGVVLLVVQNKYWEYHWWLLLPPLALLGAAGLASSGPAQRWRGSGAAVLGAIVVAGLAAPAVVYQVQAWAPTVTGRVSRAAFEHRFTNRQAFSYSNNREVARYLQAHTGPEEYVLVWGFEPQIYYLADRRCPTRFGFDYPLYAAAERDPALGAKWQGEFLRDLNAHPPTYLVVADNDQNDLLPLTSRALWESRPELVAFREGYRAEVALGIFTLWRRR
ncbi:MAG TPA: glycosyltransferase family 39 protein [Armatimonadota bacterium]|jgi:4-amino-4-deoxy-L-arabinose transferase-like glycosyltransferase